MPYSRNIQHRPQSISTGEDADHWHHRYLEPNEGDKFRVYTTRSLLEKWVRPQKQLNREQERFPWHHQIREIKDEGMIERIDARFLEDPNSIRQRDNEGLTLLHIVAKTANARTTRTFLKI